MVEIYNPYDMTQATAIEEGVRKKKEYKEALEAIIKITSESNTYDIAKKALKE